MSAIIRILRRGESKETAIELPPITSFEYNMQANLTEVSTLIYGYRNNFCMDMGNTLRLTVRCERVNPQPYNDRSSDPTRWSNGKWYRYLEENLDFWQNLAMDPEKPSVMAGGFRFEFIPDDTTLFPTQGYNVFMVGNLNMTYKTAQTMQVTFPLIASRMTGEATKMDMVTITMTSDTYTSGSVTASTSAPKGFTVKVPSLPDEWEGDNSPQPGMVFVGWTDPKGNVYNSGDTTVWGEDMTLKAVWKGAYKVYAYTAATHAIGKELTLNVPAGATRAKAYIVGGGGGAGGSSNATSARPQYYTGGGGGSGEALELPEREVIPYGDGTGDIITIYLGKGGDGGHNATAGVGSSDGEGGSETWVRITTYEGGSTLNSMRWGDTARGGAKGIAAETYGNEGGTGGATFMAGGTSSDGLNGGDGKTSAPNITANAGKGGQGRIREAGISNVDKPIQGGNGGGAAAFRYTFRDNDGSWYPAQGKYYESIGGNGSDEVDDTYAQPGYLGGGGGSGNNSGQYTGRGGDGAAVIVFYS